MAYAISKQHYWGSGEYAVEIANGGYDYMGCDAIEVIGEYKDPREAMDIAIKEWKNWQKTQDGVILAFGSNLDMIEGSITEQEDVENAAIRWAKAQFDSLPKCDYCLSPIYDEPIKFYDLDDTIFCSENCGQIVYEELFELDPIDKDSEEMEDEEEYE